MLLDQIFAKNAKNDPKTLFEASKSVKKIKFGKSRLSPQCRYVTTVVSAESGHVTLFQRSGTCVCGEGTSRIFGSKAISAVMLSQWEDGALL